MTLSFPNPSRSYDDAHKTVRFWGHDGAFEITFAIDIEALAKLQALAVLDEATILRTFDRCRQRIIDVASAQYRRRRSSAYLLVAADF